MFSWIDLCLIHVWDIDIIISLLPLNNLDSDSQYGQVCECTYRVIFEILCIHEYWTFCTHFFLLHNACIKWFPLDNACIHWFPLDNTYIHRLPMENTHNHWFPLVNIGFHQKMHISNGSYWTLHLSIENHQKMHVSVGFHPLDIAYGRQICIGV